MKFRTAVDELFSDRIERVVLFGSRARGDAKWKVAVFLHGFSSEALSNWNSRQKNPLRKKAALAEMVRYFAGAEEAVDIEKLMDVSVSLYMKHNVFIDANLYDAGSWRQDCWWMNDIRRDGVDL